MRAVDTNVVVRLCVLDDPDQTAIAAALIDEPFLLLPTVLLEAEWVLRSFYSYDAVRIANDLSDVASHPNAVTVSPSAVLQALDALRRGADFADMLHIALAVEANATRFATFDRGIAKRLAGTPIAIETLT
jgi:predicted nucleic acid-binding protein